MKLVVALFFLFSTALFLVPTTEATAELVETVCSRAHNGPNCIASLESNPDSANATLEQLGIIALRLASDNATSTSWHIKQLLNDTANLEPGVDQALNDCYDHYLDAIEQLDDSLAAILSKAPKDVQAWVDAAISDVTSCEDAVRDRPAAAQELSARNAMFRQLCNNVLVIVKMLMSQE